MLASDEKTLDDFTDKEIEDEYIERFGAPDEPDLDDFTAGELLEELNSRGKYPESEAPARLGEIADLLAEAARVSVHAKEAYALLSEAYPGEMFSLPGCQRLIDARRAA